MKLVKHNFKVGDIVTLDKDNFKFEQKVIILAVYMFGLIITVHNISQPSWYNWDVWYSRLSEI